jgi:hypothetical protein
MEQTNRHASTTRYSNHFLVAGTLLFSAFLLWTLPTFISQEFDATRHTMSSWQRVLSGDEERYENDNGNGRGLGKKNSCRNFLPPDMEEKHDPIDGDEDVEIGEMTASAKEPEDRCDAQQFASFCEPGYHHTSCRCQDPTVGDPMHNGNGFQHIGNKWEAAFAQQRQRVADIVESPDSPPVDVVFLGDSITEHWVGEGLGEPEPKYDGIHAIYQQLFTKAGGGTVEGLVLAISGERTWNVLYRLQNNALGEEDDSNNDGRRILDPKVFWLTIGTNDYGGECCSSENIVVGNIAIVRELQLLRPDATVVINGILPRGKSFDSVLLPVNE